MSKKINIKPLPLAKYILLSKDFRENYLSYEDFVDQSITVTRLIFYIISDLRNYIFISEKNYSDPDNQTKLKLWNDEFCSGGGLEINLRYNIKSFLRNRDKHSMKKVLKFLKDFKNEEYTFFNSSNKPITTSGGLIENWKFAEHSGNFEISISQYWANKIVALGVYNKFIISLLDILKNNKQVFFVTWLLELPDGKGQARYTMLQERYKIKYANRYEFCRSFLLPIKTKLDKEKDGVSFNFSYDKENKELLYFTVYPLKPLEEITVNTQKKYGITDSNIIKDSRKTNPKMIGYRSSYYKRQFNLTPKQVIATKNKMKEDYHLFEMQYALFKKEYRKEKLTAKTVGADRFIKRMINTVN